MRREKKYDYEVRVAQSNNMRLTFFLFSLTSNQHPTHLTPQKGLRVTPDLFVSGHRDVSFSDLPVQKGTKVPNPFKRSHNGTPLSRSFVPRCVLFGV